MMMLPRRVATRLKLIAGMTVFAMALPAFTGFDRTDDSEPKRETESAAQPKIRIPFSLDAWRTRVGTAQEAIRVLVDGSAAKIEPAHPPQNPLFGAGEEVSPIAAYAPNENWAKSSPLPDDERATISNLIGDDGEAFAAALSAFRNGDFAGGDAAAAKLKARLPETVARWAGIKLHPKQAGFARIAAFLEEHPDWPSAEWARRRAEEYLIEERQPDSAAREFFARTQPLTGYGKYALARARAHDGAFEEASALARDAWREDDLSGAEAGFFKELGALLTPADHKFRADRLFYGSKFAMAVKSAELAGPEFAAQARARLTSLASQTATNDPVALFLRVRAARNANKFSEAGALLRKAPQEPEKVVDGDSWWEERKVVARKLLDMGDARTAYIVAAQHAAKKATNKVDAEFLAGWIALRFLSDTVNAERHFARLSEAAETPLQKSRGFYWQGRAAEAAADNEKARGFYAKAAEHSTSFYGQLAAARIGNEDSPLRIAPTPARGEERTEAVRAAELLFAVGEREIGASLALDAAKYLESPAQVSALAEVITRQQDAKLSLLYGKQAAYRGIALDDVAFPAIGVPNYQELPGSAARSIVFAIARQESAFDARAISHAGAMGLMQMIASTAHATAITKRVPFDIARMLNEPAYNAQLGAAHLGILLHDYRGHYLLTFAAYNAGGGRVQQWVSAYGDPRRPDVDPVDWIERIPIPETRNYVQRVMENFVVYRARFADTSTRHPHQELARAGL